MTLSPILMYAWGALFFLFLGLLVYRGQLTRYEDEQLFLNDDEFVVQRTKNERERILQRLTRLKPIFNTCAVAAGLVTTTVVGIYVYNAWQQIP